MNGSRGHGDHRGPRGALQQLQPVDVDSQYGHRSTRHLGTYDCEWHVWRWVQFQSGSSQPLYSQPKLLNAVFRYAALGE